MKKINWKLFAPHMIAIAIFAIVALIYCKPSLEGKVLQQHDTSQWKAMAQSSFEFKEKHGHYPLWINSMFSGMPAFQIAMDAHDFPSFLDVTPVFKILTLGLPMPSSFFFLACICFYILALSLGCNPLVAIFTSLGYAYCTYNPIILVAGHQTKLQCIALFPLVVAGLTLLFKQKYIIGTIVTTVATCYMIATNHYQIAYYCFICAAFMSVSFIVYSIKNKEIMPMVKSLSLAAISAIVGVLVCAIGILTTAEFSKATIRGGSVLSESSKEKKSSKDGLSTDYAFSYSLYKTEPLVMMFPRMYGGSSGLEIAEDKSKAIEALQQMPPQLGQQLQQYLQFYWGGIGGTSGPPYVGAILCFLALMGFVVLEGKYKWWILSAFVMSILLSWGQYFIGFNTWVLNNLPMYNKFRAPSMILVIPTFLIAMMAALTLNKFVYETDKDLLFAKYKKGLMVVASIFAITMLVYVTSDFSSEADKALTKQVSEITDAQQKESISASVKTFVNALKEDRRTLFMGDIVRSLLFVLFAAGVLLLSIKNKLKSWMAVSAIGIVAFIDVMYINSNYLNTDKYQESADYDNTFKPSAVDEEIRKDKGNYRVFDVSNGTQSAFNQGAMLSYFHTSIGGYNPAKLSIYQDLIEKHLYNFPACLNIVNMLNAKYIIQSNPQNRQQFVTQNPSALGNCWFVKGVLFKKGPLAVIESLTNFNTKDSAVVDEAEKDAVKLSSAIDTAAKISLVKNENDLLEYTCNNSSNGFAVFSEVYYNKGWKAYIDDKESPIVKTNYVLRGLSVPAGNHKIRFEFKPESFYTGLKISIVMSIILWLIVLGGFFLLIRDFAKKNKE
jgi:Bacterial membrane protein YfhO